MSETMLDRRKGGWIFFDKDALLAYNLAQRARMLFVERAFIRRQLGLLFLMLERSERSVRCLPQPFRIKYSGP